MFKNEKSMYCDADIVIDFGKWNATSATVAPASPNGRKTFDDKFGLACVSVEIPIHSLSEMLDYCSKHGLIVRTATITAKNIS